MKGFVVLADVVADWSAERQAVVTGVPAETLLGLVASQRKARGAGLYMATGVNQGRSGTLCFWLLECINAISGNLDRPCCRCRTASSSARVSRISGRRG